jgi:hypothetical protein
VQVKALLSAAKDIDAMIQALPSLLAGLPPRAIHLSSCSFGQLKYLRAAAAAAVAAVCR